MRSYNPYLDVSSTCGMTGLRLSRIARGENISADRKAVVKLGSELTRYLEGGKISHGKEDRPGICNSVQGLLTLLNMEEKGEIDMDEFARVLSSAGNPEEFDSYIPGLKVIFKELDGISYERSLHPDRLTLPRDIFRVILRQDYREAG